MSPTSRIVVIGLIVIPLSVVAGQLALRAQGSAQSAAVARMHAHLATLEEVEYAVVRGDLDDVKEGALKLTNQLSMDGLPTDGQKYLSDLKAAALETSRATNLEAAAAGVGRMTAACGTCHAVLGRAVKVEVPARPSASGSMSGRMRDHHWAVQVMSLGLQSPSDQLWMEGAKAIETAAVVRPAEAGASLPPDIVDAEAAFRALGAKAQKALDPVARGAVYGELVASCGNCHALHGRIFGPIVPLQLQ